MKWIVLLAAVPSFVLAVAATAVTQRIARRVGFVDQPAAHKFNPRAVALGGGIAIGLAVVLPFAIGTVLLLATDPEAWRSAGPLGEFFATHGAGARSQLGHLWTLLGGAAVMLLMGLVDDVRGLDWRLRLSLQAAIAALFVWQGWQLSLFLISALITVPLSVLWIVGLVNSFNLLDNMDGLSAGVALIVSLLLALVMLIAPDPTTHEPQLFVAGFAAVLAGALLGFLVFNWSPASIFMGDAGSYFVGFLIAAATLMATFAGGDLPAHAILAPLCLLAVPIYDTVSVVAIRLHERRSPFQGDKRHFSHRLVALGMTTRQAVGTVYLVTVGCGLGGLLLFQVNGGGAAVVLLMVASVLAIIAVLEAAARR